MMIALLDGVGKLAVILVGLVGHLVAVKSDVSDLGAGAGMPLPYPEPARRMVFHGSCSRRHGNVHMSMYGVSTVTSLTGSRTQGDLVAIQHGDPRSGAELVGAGVLVAQNGNLVLD